MKIQKWCNQFLGARHLARSSFDSKRKRGFPPSLGAKGPPHRHLFATLRIKHTEMQVIIWHVTRGTHPKRDTGTLGTLEEIEKRCNRGEWRKRRQRRKQGELGKRRKGGGIGKMVMEETGEMEEKVVMMYRPPNRTTHHAAGSKRASSGSAFVFFEGARQLGM